MILLFFLPTDKNSNFIFEFLFSRNFNEKVQIIIILSIYLDDRMIYFSESQFKKKIIFSSRIKYKRILTPEKIITN